MLPPSLGLNSKPSKLAACFMLDSYLPYSSTLNMEVIYSSETSVDFHRTTQCFIPEDRTLQICLVYVHFTNASFFKFRIWRNNLL
jgi:hypothetical protein